MSDLLLALLSIAGGLALLTFGGELLLRGSVGLAKRFGLSPLLIGLTVVASATSLPELVVTLTAAFEGLPDVGTGNIVGSNIANIWLILGAAALLHAISTPRELVLRDGGVMLFATVVFVVFAVMGVMTWYHGLLLLACLVAYIWWSYAKASHQVVEEAPSEEAQEALQAAPAKASIALVLVALGMAGLVAGSELLINGAIYVARLAGLSEAVIGLTLVAFGTSLPELATAIIASLRKHPDVALGNVLGSNIFNILGILGCLVIATPIGVSHEILAFDIWVMLAATLILLAAMLTQNRLSRWEGFGFLALYVLFTAVQVEKDALLAFLA